MKTGESIALGIGILLLFVIGIILLRFMRGRFSRQATGAVGGNDIIGGVYVPRARESYLPEMPSFRDSSTMQSYNGNI